MSLNESWSSQVMFQLHSLRSNPLNQTGQNSPDFQNLLPALYIPEFQDISVHLRNCTCHVLIAADVFIKRLMTSARENHGGADGHSAICRIEQHLLSRLSHYRNRKAEVSKSLPSLNPLWLKVHAGILMYRCTYTPTRIHTHMQDTHTLSLSNTCSASLPTLPQDFTWLLCAQQCMCQMTLKVTDLLSLHIGQPLIWIFLHFSCPDLNM